MKEIAIYACPKIDEDGMPIPESANESIDRIIDFANNRFSDFTANVFLEKSENAGLAATERGIFSNFRRYLESNDKVLGLIPIEALSADFIRNIHELYSFFSRNNVSIFVGDSFVINALYGGYVGTHYAYPHDGCIAAVYCTTASNHSIAEQISFAEQSFFRMEEKYTDIYFYFENADLIDDEGEADTPEYERFADTVKEDYCDKALAFINGFVIWVK